MTEVYSDRMYQWDFKKCYCLKEILTSSRGDDWNSASAEEVEIFLKAYFLDKDLMFIGMEQGCKVSNGFPFWVFYIVHGKTWNQG